VELLVSMTILAVVLAGVLGVLARQQRFYRDLVDVIESRRQVRHAIAVLQPELRAISADALAPDGTDVLALADSAIELRALIGGSVLCGHDSAARLELPARTLSGGSVLTSWHSMPREGDAVFVYDEGPTDDAADDRWRTFELASVEEGGSYCAASPLVRPADAGRPRYRLTLASGAPIPASIHAGAPVRVARRTRYSLYRAATGDWFLGQREWSGRWGTIQPVSGPYLPFSTSPASSGLSLAALDSTGAAIDPGGRVAALLATVRVRTSAPLRAVGFARGARDVSRAAVATPAWWAR
jgi:hypothetical protein